jgi:hypothetical protein
VRVPLTLAIVRALLADAGGERYAVPLAYVAETVEFDPGRSPRCGPGGARGARAGDADRAPPRAGREASGGAPPRAPTVILEVGDAGPRWWWTPARAAGHRGRAVRRPAGMPPFVGVRRFSPTARRRSFSTPRRCCRKGDHGRRPGLKELQLDALREVANIGAGHAATALSQMTNRTIMIAVPEVNVRALRT